MPLTSEAFYGFGARRRLLMATACAFSLPWSCARSETVALPTGNGLNAKEGARAEQSMQMCSSANGSGVGLLAEYFGADQCKGIPVLSRVEGPIDWDPAELWSEGRPASARWHGWVKPPIPGNYRFHATHPGARIVVARQSFPDENDQSKAVISLEAGRYYPISLEVHALHVSTSPIRLEWIAPHGMQFLIPKSLLYLPT